MSSRRDYCLWYLRFVWECLHYLPLFRRNLFMFIIIKFIKGLFLNECGLMKMCALFPWESAIKDLFSNKKWFMDGGVKCFCCNIHVLSFIIFYVNTDVLVSEKCNAYYIAGSISFNLWIGINIIIRIDVCLLTWKTMQVYENL